MFRPAIRQSPVRTAFGLAELIFHVAVRHVRKSHRNALVGLLINILQTVMMLAVFWLMFTILGMRRSTIRGDFLLYLMSGIFMFMTHTKTIVAIVGADGPTSPMMKHAPMNTIVVIAATALGSLYTQILSAAVVLYFYSAAFVPLTIEQPVGMMGMVLLSWGTGVAIGMMLLAAKPWAPDAISMITTIYQRANMIASGKMFVANAMPSFVLRMFDWNPLFHTIDQARGFIFLNYHPHYSSISYPVKVMIICAMIGLMGEFYTRKHASVSWGAKG